MSKESESYRELDRIKDSSVYKDFEEMTMKISNLGVATAAIGGILRRWCNNHGEKFIDALVLMGVADRQANELSESLRRSLE